MDQKFLNDAILGNKPELFEQIWPVYKAFLEDSMTQLRAENYFLDKVLLIDDFYRWLAKKPQYHDKLALIDRRAGGDRRGDLRAEKPGRRQIDIENAIAFKSSLAQGASTFIKAGADLSNQNPD